ncbi:sialidase family protein [Streptomyces sp. NBC_00091]|uniref:sialidase family protein n=1 Tax=Streptomyces sp. NBC_00091 TaxID=2975648 RepID=UPI0022589370|nr:sialidase family protein [Streptomyces sp. NBC_00091]MCX5376651.1 exo-alpha-sialidase [Streptomyces sp. NBC_00091]
MSSQQAGVRIRWGVRVWIGAAALVALVLVAVVLLPGAPAGGGKPGAAGGGAAKRPGGLTAAVSAPFSAFTEGYDCYRIPTLITTKDGTLLAIAEARTASCNDIGDIDLVLKRSTDEGRTWGPMQVVRGAGDPGAYGNPVPVVDSASGRITLLHAYSTWTPDADGNRVRGPRELRLAHSTDDGAGWSTDPAPQPQLKGADWAWVSVGPGHGIQLTPTRPDRPGRLVVSADYRTESNESGAQLLYSDDGGLTWRPGARWGAPEGTPAPNEPALTQLPDGRIYVNARSTATCGTADHRVAAIVEDAAAPAVPEPGFLPVPALPAPPASGSVLQLPGGPLLLSAPSRPGAEFSDRWTLAVRTSKDEGRTWSKGGAVVLRERAGYSDMTVLPGGRVGMLYETANGTPHGYIKFTAFGPHELQAATEDLTPRRTTDATPYHNHAVVHGAPKLGNRPDGGKAMRFDGKDDFLRLIDCPDELRIGEGDFAVATWVKYKTRGQDRDSGLRQPLVWGYGQGPAAKQFRIEADPATGGLEATVNAGTGPASVATRTRVDDDAWHHVVLQRKGTRLELSVDGAPAATTGLTPDQMDFRPTGAFTVHLGTQPDYKAFYAGALDDVRIYGRALSGNDMARLRDGNDLTDQERVRLTFDRIW